MKKFFALLLSLCMILGLAACGGNNDQPNSTPDTPKQDAPAPAEGDKTPDPEPAAQEDTIVIMAPPSPVITPNCWPAGSMVSRRSIPI